MRDFFVLQREHKKRLSDFPNVLLYEWMVHEVSRVNGLDPVQKEYNRMNFGQLWYELGGSSDVVMIIDGLSRGDYGLSFALTRVSAHF